MALPEATRDMTDKEIQRLTADYHRVLQYMRKVNRISRGWGNVVGIAPLQSNDYTCRIRIFPWPDSDVGAALPIDILLDAYDKIGIAEEEIGVTTQKHEHSDKETTSWIVHLEPKRLRKAANMIKLLEL